MEIVSVTVKCSRHNLKVYRKGDRIMHYSGNANAICDSKVFAATSVSRMNRDETARELIIMEFAESAAKAVQEQRRGRP